MRAETARSKRRKTALPRRFWVGLAVALASMAGVLAITGALRRDGSYAERALLVDVDVSCQQRPSVFAQALVGDGEIVLDLGLFGEVLDEHRAELVAGCSPPRYSLSFQPRSIRAAPHTEELAVSLLQCPPGNYCFTLDPAAFKRSHGHISILTGRRSVRETLSSRRLELGVAARRPDVDISVEVVLPAEAVPVNPIPAPDYMIAAASPLLYYRASPNWGPSVPVDGHRGRLQTVGLKLPYSTPNAARLETLLLFVLAALFGTGIGPIFEVLSSRETEPDAGAAEPSTTEAAPLSAPQPPAQSPPPPSP